jgi:hypothetical protein
VNKGQTQRLLESAAENLLRLANDVEAGLMERLAQSFAGPRSASYGPRGLDLAMVQDDDDIPPGYADPTARSALAGCEDDVRAMGDLARKCWALSEVGIHLASRYAIVDAVEEDGPGADLCASCWRDDHWKEPVALRETGVPYRKNRCRWCASFESIHNLPVPLQILKARHAGKRITTEMVAKHLPQRKAG